MKATKGKERNERMTDEEAMATSGALAVYISRVPGDAILRHVAQLPCLAGGGGYVKPPLAVLVRTTQTV